MTLLPFQRSDPARSDFQFLEDLATAYWYSEVLFAALELKLFDHLGSQGRDLAHIAPMVESDPEEMQRLLTALQRLELVDTADGNWFNSQLAREFLVSDQPTYLGHVLLYRRYMKTGWERLSPKLCGHRSPKSTDLSAEDDYDLRNYHYVRAMDALARAKADDIVKRIPDKIRHSPILDIGGGAGALSRAIIRSHPDCEAYLLELPEVIRAARKIYPHRDAWDRMHTIDGDFRHHQFDIGQQFGMVLMGNFLHAYGADEARRLLEKAVAVLAPDGLLVVHDYFPDRINGPSPHKGALYDLCMMLNTQDGRCHTSETIAQWMQAAGLDDIRSLDLATDSSLMLAARVPGSLADISIEDWAGEAQVLGLRHAVEIPVEEIVLAAWTAAKCRFGCASYGQNLQCPPNAMDSEQTRAILKEYSRAILVEGAPPGKAFHESLLGLERKAFLAGYHKALVFGAGPCPACRACPDGGVCLRPDKARPSMEGAGMDVYATARNAGVTIAPVAQKGDYVKYIGLMLLE